LYSTYLGGNQYDQIYGLTTDEDGNIYVTGLTDSPNFPVTAGTYQRTFGGGEDDVFVTKFVPGAKSLVYSTFIGGREWDEGYAIALDPERNAIVCGFTRDDNFPTTPGAFQSFRPGWDDGFVSKLSSDGTRLIYSTYLGADDNNDVCWDLVSDDSGGVFVTGFTDSSNFPTTDGSLQQKKSTVHSRDGFIAHLHANGISLLASTYFGRPGEFGSVEAVDIKRHGSLIYITGNTTVGRTFPVTRNGGSDSMRGEWDGFISILSPGLDSLIFSGLIGGDKDDGCHSVFLYHQRLVIAAASNSTGYYHKTCGNVETSNHGSFDVMLVLLDLDEILPVERLPSLNEDYVMFNSYPNPVGRKGNGYIETVTIPFQLSRSASVNMEICDIDGRTVERKCFGSLAPGHHQYVLSSAQLVQGVYFYRLTVAGKSMTKKFVVLQ
jgi:hypothetical protein